MTHSVKRKYYQDPGHGWLAVKVHELVELGIDKHVSRCSYVRGKTAYLEEDCDATLYINALKERGVAVEVISRHTNSSSPIRGYDYYSAGS